MRQETRNNVTKAELSQHAQAERKLNLEKIEQWEEGHQCKSEQQKYINRKTKATSPVCYLGQKKCGNDTVMEAMKQSTIDFSAKTQSTHDEAS